MKDTRKKRCITVTKEANAVLADMHNASAWVNVLAEGWEQLLSMSPDDMAKTIEFIDRLFGPARK